MIAHRFSLFAMAAMVILLTTSSAHAQSSGYMMTETEKDAIREVVREYIVENPEVVLEALEKKARADVKAQQENDARMTDVPDGLYDYPLTPVAGNEDGELVVVEFFDYNCGYCKRVVSDVNRIIEDEPNVKYMFKELPILSDSSGVAARYALAANKQGKYMEMHTRLMNHQGRLNEDAIRGYAQELGLDMDQLDKDRQAQDIDDALTKNIELAQELGVRGTPFFVIGKEKIPGAVGYTRMKSIIEQERASAE